MLSFVPYLLGTHVLQHTLSLPLCIATGLRFAHKGRTSPSPPRTTKHKLLHGQRQGQEDARRRHDHTQRAQAKDQGLFDGGKAARRLEWFSEQPRFSDRQRHGLIWCLAFEE